MDLSIIIVNWNSREYLRQCIASILAETHGIEYEIVVIDNASFDGSDEMLRECYPQVRFIQSDANLGFAKANNDASKESSGRVLLFLNPDTKLESDAIKTLYQQLDSLPNAALVGAKLLNSDKSVQTSCIRAFPTILNQILDSNALRACSPRARLWGMKPLFDSGEAPTEVDAISGACLMIRRSVFESVGMFSTDFFMYSEDIDICFKVSSSGWKKYFVPTAVVIHHGGASSLQNGINTFSTVMMLESRWRYFRRTRSLWYSRFFRAAIFSASIVRIVLLVLILPVRVLRGRKISVESGLKKWVASLHWAIGSEDWVKTHQPQPSHRIR
jgi:hypothetical protein